ncbi:hypothetical protein [Amycolatopsis pittospori]|uniref:hypothetical protein n=1 Tax=Amycolatopsis pittospori TaxID=2749434 RepID=UPI002E2E28E8|nr:hypothetical protein [Amycolatopsis pittospori]
MIQGGVIHIEYVVAWSAFLGGWLLVAGPMYQGALELREESERFEDLRSVQSRRPTGGTPTSSWWWLVPPVAVIKERRRRKKVQREFMKTLTAGQRRTMTTFANKAKGWFIVCAGAFFIALKETWHLTHLYHWPLWTYIALVLVPLVLSFLHTSRGVRLTVLIMGAEE